MKKLLALLGVLVLLPLLLGPALAAWPLTPLTTYNAGTTPVIKAADLNSFQSAINDLFLGNKTHKAISVDTVGGTPVVGATPGMIAAVNLLVSRTTMGGTTPTATVAPGEVARSATPLCWAQVNGTNATLIKGFNVFSVARNGANTGDFRVLCNSLSAFQTGPAILATCSGFGGLPCVATASEYLSGGHLGATVRISRLNGNAYDDDFSVVVYGE